jgi:Rab GDP dissociation inhibitor
MNGAHYDVIVCGTGFKECLLSGLLSVGGKKLLHMDRNTFYGGECSSLNITQFFRRFFGKDPPVELGDDHEWHIDLIPKFIMADGLLFKALVHTEVTENLKLRMIAGSYVYRDKKVEKVPWSASEALSTSLIGFFEKRRLKNFLEHVGQVYEHPDDPKHARHEGQTALEMMTEAGLDVGTMTFIGHTMALEPDDSYLGRPCWELIRKMTLYADSDSRYRSQNSPYLYPMYGLGDLMQALTRLCAIWGGTYLLGRPIDKILMVHKLWTGRNASVLRPTEAKRLLPQIVGHNHHRGSVIFHGFPRQDEKSGADCSGNLPTEPSAGEN